ncbi:hypothetical protein [Micromonospora tulbaghiae]|uniref:hypothetical protein n=1 Tax=Micromonospora tulbaghiae TaxID=479978 RepID=UPI003EBE784A
MINIITAELIKLRSLPVVLATIGGTVAAAVALTAAVAASETTTSPAQVVIRSITFVQVGLILLGALVIGTDYTGSNMRTALTATPNRGTFLAGKCVAYLLAAVTTSAATVVAGLLTATLTLAVRDRPTETGADAWPMIGVGVYLVLIGILGLALALLLRSLVPPLVAMLSLVLIVSPLLSTLTSYAQYLPDQAGSLLYHPQTAAELTSGTGVLVLLTWIAAIGTGAVMEFRNRDA